jgi:flagellar biogenesis protein FliO
MVNNKLEQSNQISTIKVIERRSLSPKTSIYLIEIHEKTIALAESADGVALLTEFPFTLSQTEGEAQEVPSAFKKILDNKTQ